MTAHRLTTLLVAVTVLGGLAGRSLPAQSTPPSAPKCDAPEYRQFDFWVGTWDVTMRGQPAGRNLVTLEESGCLIHEHWTGTRGGTGQSFNFFDRDDGAWHQIWVSNSGGVLYLTGHYADGTLTYQGQNRRPDGTTVRHRLSFRPNGDGTVRQLWETSSDSGATWAVSFDGHYVKRKG